MTEEESLAAALFEEAAALRDTYLVPAVSQATEANANPAAMVYALLDAALNVAVEQFPGDTESLYAAATQMVFEARFGSSGGRLSS